MSHIIVTGVPRGPAEAGPPPPRLEINTLIADEKQFSLYIQALQRMYATPQTQGASHFQLGGIHGLPFQPWEGAGARQVPGSRFGGYCTHGTVLFPTWHRPYLAIYEQVLHDHAIAIAKQYTVDAAAWNDAAKQFRMPYWDWASNSVPPAQVISMAQVTITTPNGQRTAVRNPLLAYPFNPIDRSFPAPYSRWPATLRHPQTAAANAQSNVNEMISWLRSDQQDIRDSTFNLLTRVRTWPAFSNHTVGDGGSASNSLEAIHDGIHVDIGGNGHMSDPAVAAFDPIFFLHHANVDRIAALWQAMNPDVWVTSGRGTVGTWTLSAATRQDTNTDLTPFWNGAQTFWDSTDSRDFSAKLGYTYPEFVGLDLANKPAVRAAVSARINQLYGSGARQAFAFAAANTPSIAASAAELVGQTPATQVAPLAAMQLFALPAGAAPAAAAPAGAAPAAAAAARVAAPAQAPLTKQPPTAPAAGRPTATYTEWTARVHVNKYAVGCSFSVLVFLGPVPEDPSQWRSSESYVGAHHVFMNSAAEECENCRNTAEAETEGFVHLNKAIAARSGLHSFDSEVVEPYLKENLAWRILKVDRSSSDNAEVASLQVIVIATPLAFEEGAVFPHAGTGRHCHDITEGQPGGYHAH